MVTLAVAIGLLSISTPAGGQGDLDTVDAKYAEVLYKRDGKLKECTFVETWVRPIQGGCTMRLSTDAHLNILTPFGPMHYKDCEFRFTAHIASNGEIVLDDQSTSGVADGPSCTDVRACREDTDADRKPWIGRIAYERPNRFRMGVDLCLEANTGWFRGPIEMGLRRTPDGWRLRADHALAGDSGLEIDGEWRIRRHDLLFRLQRD